MLCVGALSVVTGAALLSGCPDKKAKYPVCDGDKDCKGGEHCVAKKCQQCGEDSHCPDGETCKDGACVAKKDACTDDDQCGDGVCKNGACTKCESNDECGPGGKCNAGVCDRPKKCSVNEDCADDEDCVDGRCRQPWNETTEDVCEIAVVYFDYDSSAVPPAGRETLADAVECIKKQGDRNLYIIGHTDESGTDEYNIALSERRASAVADYLARLGIDPARFNIIPKGETEPSGKGDAQDRRVEFEWR
jgi:peptidoglycan-associated lipoprotein